MNFTKFFEMGSGTVPIILSCSHGGFLKPKDIPDKLKGVRIADKNKFIISKRIIQVLKLDYNIEVFYILSKIHRSKIDFNRPPRAFSALNHESDIAKKIHSTYHKVIKRYYKECIKNYGKCLFIDLHGFTKPHKDYPDIIFGNIFGHTLKIYRDSNIWGFSELISDLSKDFSLDDGLGISDFNLAYSGGYITHKFYKRPFCNAFQIEVAKYIRENIVLTRRFIERITTAINICLKKI